MKSATANGLDKQHLVSNAKPTPNLVHHEKLKNHHFQFEYFTWKTEGDANGWKVVVIWSYENDGYEAYELNFTEWLFNVLKGKTKVPGFKSTWNPKTDISFETEVYSG